MKKRLVKNIKLELKLRCLGALSKGLKGHTFLIPTGRGKRFKIEVEKIADFMVKEMWKSQ